MTVCGRTYIIPSSFRLPYSIVELSQIVRPVVRYQRYKLNIVPISFNCQFDTTYNLLRRKSLFCIYLFMCMGILPACPCVHHLNAWCPKRTEGTQDGTGSLGTGVPDNYGFSSICQESNLGPLEQLMLLITDSSLHPIPALRFIIKLSVDVQVRQ